MKAVVCRTAVRRPPLLVIAHRGASGYRPEHTLEAYRLAIEQGADFIEPDLVATADGELVARHENELSATTDVASHPQFRVRRTTKCVDGHRLTGWFTEDFTLAELRTLRCRERRPRLRRESARHDGLHPIPTLAEIVRLAKEHTRGGRRIGIYPETKHPTYFAREGRRLGGGPIGVSLGARLIDVLVAEGFTDPAAVYIQSFEVGNLLELKDTLMPRAGVALPLVQLIGKPGGALPYDLRWHRARGDDLAAIYGGMPAGDGLASPHVLQWMRSRYAEAIGVRKSDLLRRAGSRDASSPLIAAAVAAGLPVHAYTIRADDPGLFGIVRGGRARAQREAERLYAAGVQGMFFDHPDVGAAARNRCGADA